MIPEYKGDYRERTRVLKIGLRNAGRIKEATRKFGHHKQTLLTRLKETWRATAQDTFGAVTVVIA